MCRRCCRFMGSKLVRTWLDFLFKFTQTNLFEILFEINFHFDQKCLFLFKISNQALGASRDLFSTSGFPDYYIHMNISKWQSWTSVSYLSEIVCSTVWYSLYCCKLKVCNQLKQFSTWNRKKIQNIYKRSVNYFQHSKQNI